MSRMLSLKATGPTHATPGARRARISWSTDAGRDRHHNEGYFAVTYREELAVAATVRYGLFDSHPHVLTLNVLC